MTLVVASATSKLAIIVADGRLTSGLTGRVLDDEENKLAVVTFPGGWFGVGVTGLAQILGMSTSEWFADSLTQLAVQRHSGAAKPLLEAVAGQLTADVRRMRIPPNYTALSIIGVGFIQSDPSPSPAAFIVSNVETFDGSSPSVTLTLPPSTTFHVSVFDSTWDEQSANWDPFHFFAGSGAEAARADHSRLAAVLFGGAHPSHIANEAYSLIHRVAGTVRSVGTQADAAYATANGEFFFRHLTDRPVAGFSHPIFVDVAELSPYVYYFGDTRRLARIQASGATGRRLAAEAVKNRRDAPTIGPPQPKASPCFCESGRKYRHCHGRGKDRWAPARPPMPRGQTHVLLDGAELPLDGA